MDEASSCADNKQYCRDALTRNIEFYRHNLIDEDKQLLLKVLDSIFLTTGSVTAAFEEKLACYLGMKHVVGLMSCTHALELSLRYFNIGSGDEVITTPMSFVATANAIETLGATPIFVDVEQATGNIDVSLIEEKISDKTKAIVVVHLYGQMCDMIRLKSIAEKYNLRLIEDAAHCVEGSREGIRPGKMSDVACFSFYATKSMTSGEGGAIACNDQAMYNWMLQARQHGIEKSAKDRYTKKYQHYDMAFLGQKCNMSDIQAALLLNQLDRLDKYWKKRYSIASFYTEHFYSLKHVEIPKKLLQSKHALHLYTVLVDQHKRDEFMHRLQKAGIGVAVNYRPIHLMSYYRKKYGYLEGNFPVAENIGSRTISLPFYAKLQREDVNYIIRHVANIVEGASYDNK